MLSWAKLRICARIVTLHRRHIISCGTLALTCVFVSLYFLTNWPVSRMNRRAAINNDIEQMDRHMDIIDVETAPPSVRELSKTWDKFTETKRPNTLLNITFFLKVDPILMQLKILNKLKEGERLQSNDIRDVNLVGVFYTQIKKIQTLLTKEFRQFNVTEITRQLPVDLTTNRSRRTTCYVLRKGSIVVYRIIVVYFRDNFVYFPSCLHSEKPHLFTSAILGHTPMVFDRFKLRRLHIDGVSVVVPFNITEIMTQYAYSHYIECRRDMAPNFNDSNESADELNTVLPAFVYFKNDLQTLGKLPFLAAGTLLGWYRQCHFILGSGDIDIALFSHDLDVYLHDHIRTNPNIIGNHYNLPEDGYQYYLFVKGVRIDLFFLYDTNRTDIVYGGQWAPERERIRLFYPRSEICSGVLLGHRFNVPCRVEALLETEYGQEWKIRGDYGGNIQWPRNYKILEPWSDQLWKRAYMDIKDVNNVIP